MSSFSGIPGLWRPLGRIQEGILFYDSPQVELPGDMDLWREALQPLVRNRMCGLALRAAKTHGLELAPGIEQALRQVHSRAVARTLNLEGEAPRISTLLANHGIPCVVSKGPGLARAYPDPSLRVYGDLDIIVATEQLRRTVRVLAEHGFAESDGRPPRNYFYTRCREATNVTREWMSIDVHHRIPPWIGGRRLTPSKLLAEAQEMPLAGEGRILVPSQRHQLVIALLHIFSHQGRPGEEPIVWRDVLTLVNQLSPEEVVGTLQEYGISGLGRYVLTSLPESVKPAIAERLDDVWPGALEFRISRLMPPRLGARHVVGMLYRLPLRHAALFAVGYAFPSREFMRRHVDRGRNGLLLTGWWTAGLGGVRRAKRQFMTPEGSSGAARSEPLQTVAHH